MATIGLNEGPFLVMTISYEKGCLIIADLVENKIPTINLSPADSLHIADSFPKLILSGPDIKVKISDAEGNAFTTVWTAIVDPLIDPSGLMSETDAMTEISLQAMVHGCPVTILIKKDQNDDGEEVTYLEIGNPHYSVKGFFTANAAEYFKWVFNDISCEPEYID